MEKPIKTIFFTMAYNAEKTIGRTIESILNQTCGNFEYFILENGATDSTGEIISKYAQQDARIKHISINRNDPTNGGAFFLTIILASNADYIAYCDADDTYSPDFLEKMIPFAEKEKLDIAICGYDSIDGGSEKILKHRAIDQQLIVYGQLFADAFIQYRGFIGTMWGRLFSIPFMKSITSSAQVEKKFAFFHESNWLFFVVWKAARIGIFPEAMYQWYQYPNSLSRTNLAENLKEYSGYWYATKQYLQQYGPISKINMDFLYAIYLSLMEDGSNFVFESNLPVSEKLHVLYDLFQDTLWAETLARDADPQFRNLAARGEFVQQMRTRVLALPTTPEESSQAEKVVQAIVHPWEKLHA